MSMSDKEAQKKEKDKPAEESSEEIPSFEPRTLSKSLTIESVSNHTLNALFLAKRRKEKHDP